MKVQRRFHPVGQGGFFSEVHYFRGREPIVIVYDCGSHDSIPLENAIESFGHKKIDYFVVSHFHSDHTNGIRKLIDNGVEIKNAILPKMDRIDVVLAYLKYVKDCDLTLAESPESIFGENVNIYLVDGDPENNLEFPISGDQVKGQKSDVSHKSPLFLSDNKGGGGNPSHLWILKFFVQRSIYDGSNKILLDELSKIPIKDLPGNKNVSEAINTIGRGNFNSTTMSMYSGPGEYYRERDKLSHCLEVKNDNRGLAVLLNGDATLAAPLHLSDLIDHYKELTAFVGDLSLPHHGSGKNLKAPILDIPYKVAYVQFGTANTYGHPYRPLLRMHEDYGIKVVEVNELCGVLVRDIDYFGGEYFCCDCC